MTVHDHRFVEPTAPYNLSGEDDPWFERDEEYEAWLSEIEARELETGDAR
jgi:hypothetical protein